MNICCVLRSLHSINIERQELLNANTTSSFNGCIAWRLASSFSQYANASAWYFACAPWWSTHCWTTSIDTSAAEGCDIALMRVNEKIDKDIGKDYGRTDGMRFSQKYTFLRRFGWFWGCLTWKFTIRNHKDQCRFKTVKESNTNLFTIEHHSDNIRQEEYGPFSSTCVGSSILDTSEVQKVTEMNPRFKDSTVLGILSIVIMCNRWSLLKFLLPGSLYSIFWASPLCAKCQASRKRTVENPAGSGEHFLW